MITAESRESDCDNSESESIALHHGLSASVGQHNSWIVNSGATCHICNDKRLFVELHNLEKPQEVAHGDDVEAIGHGVVV